MFVYVYVCVVYLCTYVYICIFIYISMYVRCMYIHIYVYVYDPTLSMDPCLFVCTITNETGFQQLVKAILVLGYQERETKTAPWELGEDVTRVSLKCSGEAASDLMILSIHVDPRVHYLPQNILENEFVQKYFDEVEKSPAEDKANTYNIISKTIRSTVAIQLVRSAMIKFENTMRERTDRNKKTNNKDIATATTKIIVKIVKRIFPSSWKLNTTTIHLEPSPEGLMGTIKIPNPYASDGNCNVSH
eukprot:GHVQ01001721.1.p1 GENE.GHVQ01001721.1~~GHVQ01001721.1.p1  ORF type:complete len:246 (-),score=4.83 GHVQ01001721.1:597-1334(-)